MSLYVFITRRSDPLDNSGPEISAKDWLYCVDIEPDFRIPKNDESEWLTQPRSQRPERPQVHARRQVVVAFLWGVPQFFVVRPLMRIPLFISLLGVTTLLTGCILVPLPHTSTKSPAIEGRVVDSNDQPVEGAHIVLENCKAWGPTDEDWSVHGARTTTGADGRFNLWPRYNLHLLWYWNPSFQFSIPGGAFWTGQLTVSYGPFYTRTYDTGSTTNGHVGDLHVTPATFPP
jgi:hypothetical protein